MSAHSLDDYLALDFVPEPERASQYVRHLFGRATDGGAADPVDLLCRIVEEEIGKRGVDEVVLPLTAGYDSRGLLGALLSVLPAKSIHCVTFGSKDFHDVTGAAAVCSRLGLEHRRLDPNRMRWDLDRFTDIARARWEKHRSLAPVDGIAVYAALADAAEGRVVLSGYLGDAVSGAHLPKTDEARTGSGVTAQFLRWNDPKIATAQGVERRTALFEKFLADHADLLGQSRSLTPFDLLDFGFRQNFRIKSVAVDAFEDCIAPYEDTRWVAHWMARNLPDRLGASSYRSIYPAAFLEVFADAPASRSLVQRAAGRVVAKMRPAPPVVPWVIQARGDARRNASIAAVFEETTRAFDQRRVRPEVSATSAFERLTGDAPTGKDFMTTRWAATAEMYVRAGILGNGTSSP
ncbi:hypothetical protein ASC61_09330 [Aeromicrobium sp. Root344]|uniref:asparagine synthase-related protein n=1 Tax=Aeromicrobium sp. Root344 TaxID=1736521 RepID=UPI0006F49C7A|nr:asparagine synthase-related protein [Aeromicrobium sp. Root344]KQV75187.1 hypothetical protein ASC61_09330 [Aeromicrobium sp. Root344]